MSGDHPAIQIEATADSVLARAVEALSRFPTEQTWVSDQIGRAFGQDIRYTLLRLRTNDRSAGARALTDADVEATVTLADELSDLLDGRHR